MSRVERRISILLGGKLRNIDKVDEAVAIQDELREKTKDVDWSGVEAIRKWRKQR